MSLCILISSSPRYCEIAQFTAVKIDGLWPDHPPIYFCGFKSEGKDNCLPLVDAPEDWMGINSRALGELMKRGYTHCYFILDDHPPIAKCSGENLNVTIPKLMDKLDAVYIGLNGHGQGKQSVGRILGKENNALENANHDFLWKFQVHPALWNLERFAKILNAVMEKLPTEKRTAWAFERKSGAEDCPIPDEWKTGSYRVDGLGMSASYSRSVFKVMETRSCDIARFLAGKISGQKGWDRVNDRFGFLYNYYEGPYPVYHSGLMKRGVVNEELLRFLAWRRNGKFLAGMPQVDVGKSGVAVNTGIETKDHGLV